MIDGMLAEPVAPVATEVPVTAGVPA
jgi:hypothetical protein